MKKYFIVSDVHSYLTLLIEALDNNAFSLSNDNHVLVVCGDLFDRGLESRELYDFVKSIPDNRFIYIRGNHEDLIIDCIDLLVKKEFNHLHHISNKTILTISQWTGISPLDLVNNNFDEVALKEVLKPYIKLIDKSINYFEIGDYVFVHGWIPTNENWRNASDLEWERARWLNGMKEAACGNTLKNKIIVCGHYYTDWGREHILKSTIKENNYGIYKNKGIIAIDTTTAISKKINVLIVEN